jgi:hypothetical protein
LQQDFPAFGMDQQLDHRLQQLRVEQENRFAHDCATRFDPSLDALVHTWQESSAGSDPYSEYLEYYRIDIPLNVVRTLAAQDPAGSPHLTLSLRVAYSHTHIDDYSGTECGPGDAAQRVPTKDNSSTYQRLYCVSIDEETLRLGRAKD